MKYRLLGGPCDGKEIAKDHVLEIGEVITVPPITTLNDIGNPKGYRIITCEREYKVVAPGEARYVELEDERSKAAENLKNIILEIVSKYRVAAYYLGAEEYYYLRKLEDYHIVDRSPGEFYSGVPVYRVSKPNHIGFSEIHND